MQLLNDDFSLGNVLAMLILDTILYGILTWYIEHVFPGAYGLPKAWYFPFQISYWLGDNSKYCTRRRLRSSLYSRMQSIETGNPPGLLAVDAEPVHLPLGVAIEDLVKVSFGIAILYQGVFLCNIIRVRIFYHYLHYI